MYTKADVGRENHLTLIKKGKTTEHNRIIIGRMCLPSKTFSVLSFVSFLSSREAKSSKPFVTYVKRFKDGRRAEN